MVMGSPQARMRGPSRWPASIARFNVRVTPNTSAQSRTVVTPPRRARRALAAASTTDSTALLCAREVTQSSCAFMTRWTWVSMRPGRSVAESRSMTSASRGMETSSRDPTARIRLPSTRISPLGTGVSPFPSMTMPPLMALSKGPAPGLRITMVLPRRESHRRRPCCCISPAGLPGVPRRTGRPLRATP